jgi:hypothetical protein
LSQFAASRVRQEAMQSNDVLLFILEVVIIPIDQKQEEKER